VNIEEISEMLKAHKQLVDAYYIQARRLEETAIDMAKQNYNIDKENINFSWSITPKSYFSPEAGLVLAGRARNQQRGIDYFSLVKQIKNERICEYLRSPCVLEISTPVGETDMIVSMQLDISATLPEEIRLALRKQGIIRDEFLSSSTYESVHCPVEAA
jgi:hypothetical protein